MHPNILYICIYHSNIMFIFVVGVHIFTLHIMMYIYFPMYSYIRIDICIRFHIDTHIIYIPQEYQVHLRLERTDPQSLCSDVHEYIKIHMYRLIYEYIYICNTKIYIYRFINEYIYTYLYIYIYICI